MSYLNSLNQCRQLKENPLVKSHRKNITRRKERKSEMENQFEGNKEEEKMCVKSIYVQ